MIPHFRDYYWKAGKPFGRDPVDPKTTLYSYKIISDPYHKRLSIEKYIKGIFTHVIYDSVLLDFRHLQPSEQIAWQRETLEESDQKMSCLLRNQDDRAILIETHYFENQYCRSCFLYSIHGFLVSVHRMYYKALHDNFNGVILYDPEDRPVMSKVYNVDPQTGEFTELLKEEWNMQNLPSLIPLKRI